MSPFTYGNLTPLGQSVFSRKMFNMPLNCCGY
jgi:hypothetical protein